MKVGVLGTGMVGNAIGTKLVELGHEVTMGAREQGNERALAWAGEAGESGHASSFLGAAEFGELVVNATAGTASLEALEQAGAEQLEDKVLLDVANPLDPDAGSPPPLAFCNTESLGERIQTAFPSARVVKALNTVNAAVMVDPGRLAEPTSIFVCGEDSVAKSQVRELLEAFGWPAESVLDLGGIAAARGTEMYLPLWLRLIGVLGDPFFNVRVVRGE
jgi:8-hydroxy-5-deazaflavin:NADPH oxidoreductase